MKKKSGRYKYLYSPNPNTTYYIEAVLNIKYRIMPINLALVHNSICYFIMKLYKINNEQEMLYTTFIREQITSLKIHIYEVVLLRSCKYWQHSRYH